MTVRRRLREPEPPSLALPLAGGPLAGLSWLLLCFRGSGDHGALLFFGLPFAIGLASGALANLRVRRGAGATVGVSLLAAVLTGCLFLVAGIDGGLCLVVALPLIAPAALIGRLLAPSPRGRKGAAAGALIGISLIAAAEAAAPAAPVRVVETAVVVDAPPERVWESVIRFPPLTERPAWYFRAGVSCPTGAVIEGEGPGAVRRCRFTTGDFVEPIRVWDAPRRLAFDVAEQPDPLHEISPWPDLRPPHLDGGLTCVKGEFSLESLPGGRTRLVGRTWYRIDMGPQLSWGSMADAILHGVHRRVLRHVARLAEGNSPRGQLPERAQVHGVEVGLALLPLRCLEEERELAEDGVVDEPAERLETHFALPDALVAVDAGAEGLLRIVHVDRAKSSEPDVVVERREVVVEGRGVAEVVAGGEGVAGVEAGAEPVAVARAGEDRRHLLRRRAHGVALARRVLHQDARLHALRGAEHAAQRRARPCDRLVAVRSGRGAGVEHEPRDAEGVAAHQLVGEGPLRADALLLVGGGEVQEVARVRDDGAERRRDEPVPEPLGILRGEGRRRPRPARPCEDLDRGHSVIGGPADRLVDAPGDGDVGAEEGEGRGLSTHGAGGYRFGADLPKVSASSRR